MGAKSPEIVSPAGTIEAGLYALKAGADAVYFGLQRFSARRAAENLTMSDVRRLKGFAAEHHKKIYAAVNTVIAEEEMSDLLRCVAELALADVDGIIVQDLGLAAHICREFPKWPMHGSTQLAVHNALGLKTAARLCFGRVVLSRELGIAEIEALKDCAPEVEREAFVHGALCYGFSGLCLASVHLTGRSGNRGECAQICRSWFEKGNDKGYFFSAADLSAGALIRSLGDAGVSAFKIEGRLKSSAYAFHTAAYYRALIDGDEDKALHHQQQSALCFARPQTSGFLKSYKSTRLINPTYPSHMGIPGAAVLSVRHRQMTVRALTDLSAHDRLFRLPSGPLDEGTIVVLTRFIKAGKTARRMAEGETAVIDAIPRVQVGDTLMKTLSHDMHLKSLSKGLFPEYKKSLSLEAAVDSGALVLWTRVLSNTVEASYPVIIEKRSGTKRFEEVLGQLFSESKDFGFRFQDLSVTIKSTSPVSDIFIPPSLLKSIRNDFYLRTEKTILDAAPTEQSFHRLSEYDLPLPPREKIQYSNHFMFVAEGVKTHATEWPLIDGRRFLCLPPVMFHSAQTIGNLTVEIKAYPDEFFVIGLNNIGHLAVADAWKQFENVSFFIDYGIYAANVQTLLFLIQSVPRLRGAYLWLEATPAQQKSLQDRIARLAGCMPPGLRFIEEKERFPMFISRICFHQSLEGTCPKKCPKSFSYPLVQNKRALDVEVMDCVTYVHLSARS